MFFDNHKKVATIIRGKRAKNGERLLAPTEMKAESVKTEDGDVDGRHTAMQDFLAAQSEKSPLKMAEALSNFVDIHGSSPAASSETE